MLLHLWGAGIFIIAHKAVFIGNKEIMQVFLSAHMFSETIRLQEKKLITTVPLAHYYHIRKIRSERIAV